MNIDGVALANIRNRIHKSQLVSELRQIEREKKAEIRMHNTSKQRFVSKYAKLDNYIHKGKEVSDVRLYETHTPGFCYRRNGEYRTPPSPPTSAPVDFEEIHSLLFTNEDVDIEKVLCLYLLSAHKTETLTPPQQNHRTLGFIAREQSPVERLIERSRKKHFHEDKLMKQLPTYIIEIQAQPNAEGKTKSEVVIRDGRLAARVIINDKIHQLVFTVIHALQNSNSGKMNQFFEKAKDPRVLNEILKKPLIHEYLESLKSCELVTSCESFHLTQPFKASTVTLAIDATGNACLNGLVTTIRRNVLQPPLQLRTYNEPTKGDIAGPPSHSHTTGKDNFENLIEEALVPIIRMKRPKVPKTKFARSENKTDAPEQLVGTTGVGNKESDTSTIFTKTELEQKHMKTISEDVENALSIFSGSPTSSRIQNMASMSSGPSNISIGNSSATGASTESQAKFTVKQMTCPACAQKWKIPLPIPKIPTLKKFVMPTLDHTTYNQLKSNSTIKLATLIEDEIRKSMLVNRTKKDDDSSLGSQGSQSTRGSILDRNFAPNSVEINILDLNRISQEIKEKETQRKLTSFLKNAS